MTKQEAVAHFKSVTALAKALGVSAPAIYQWDTVPPLRQMQLERITKGKLKADQSISKPAA